MSNSTDSRPVVWFEVMGQDPEALKRFYGELLGWRFETMGPPEQAYGMVTAQKGIPGGVGKAPEGPGWTTFYAEVPDIETSVQQAVVLGAKVLVPVTKLPEITIALVADPEGHPVGLVQTA